MSKVFNDVVLKGRTARHEAMKATTVPARILTVQEVRKFESVLDSGCALYDKYLAGCILFAIFFRSRWSDLNFLDFLELDVTDTPEGPYTDTSKAERNTKKQEQLP